MFQENIYSAQPSTEWGSSPMTQSLETGPWRGVEVPGTGGLAELAASPSILIATVGRAVRREVDAVLAAEGLTLRHLGALAHLAVESNVSQTLLAARGNVTVQTMHATVADLIARGLVSAGSTGRGRASGLAITPAGRAALDAAGAAISAYDQRFASLGSDTLRTLVAILMTVMLDTASAEPTGDGSSPSPAR